MKQCVCFAGRGHIIGHCFEDIELVVWEYLLEAQHTHTYSRHAHPQEFQQKAVMVLMHTPNSLKCVRSLHHQHGGVV